jgi:hypothetical protein
LYVHRSGFVFVDLWPHAAVCESAPPDKVCTCFYRTTKTPRFALPRNEDIITVIQRNITISLLPLHVNILRATIKKPDANLKSNGDSAEKTFLRSLLSHKTANSKQAGPTPRLLVALTKICPILLESGSFSRVGRMGSNGINGRKLSLYKPLTSVMIIPGGHGRLRKTY